MEFFEVVAARRSVRKFTDEAIPEEVMKKSITAALMAPNSSNMQPWEFYRVTTPAMKKTMAEYCLSQSAARSAAEMVVAVARIDTWKRNRDLLVEEMAREAPLNDQLKSYYYKIVPFMYRHGWFGIPTVLRAVVFFFMSLVKPAPRGPVTRAQILRVVTKTVALGCENLMLALSAQGYASCPMEGFDEGRVKKLLGLGRHAHVVMVIAVGKADPSGIWGKQIRLPEELFVHKI